jgi:two-component system, chemotaxis family, protein-glutamate methylesterase/glutaminase
VERRDIIAVGASTGGVDALKRLCAGLPGDLAAAVFVVLHMAADGPNLMPEILDRRGPLPVRLAVDGERVERGCIYVGPANHHLLVIDDFIRLGRGPRENLTRPAIDPLFRSVAATYGPRAIGVVLTGELNDGAAGLGDIKRCGGVTVVQSPADAEAPSMPSSALQASDVDYRASLAQLPDVLTHLVGQPTGPRPPVPRAVELEVDIALGRPCMTATLLEFADPAPLSCPACSGVLSQVREGQPLRYRCQVGHAYTGQALEVAQQADLDEAIRVALRIIEERAVLSERMAAEARAAGRELSARSFQNRADELRVHEETLRRAALCE